MIKNNLYKIKEAIMTNTKIFITYKDEHEIIKSDIITPIQTGRAIAKKVFKGMIGDDTGENISKSNPRYNELSAQYWVWKNFEKAGAPDYVGFMHFRRHFIFDENFVTNNRELWLPGTPVYKVKNFDKSCRNNLSDENISKIIDKSYECYVMKKNNINLFENNDLYMKEHYMCTIPGAQREVWNKFYSTVKKLYPQYQDILDNFAYGNTMHCCNMFIMSKELFFRYSEFCFNILQELEKQVDYRYFNPVEMRFLGYIGEYVLTLFIMILEQENCKIKYLDAIFIENFDNEKLPFYQNIFSMKNTPSHKVITLLGLKLKLKRNKKFVTLKEKLNFQDYMLRQLLTKVSELQEEIILMKH